MNEKDENWKGRFGCLFIVFIFGLLIPPSLENKEVRGGKYICLSLSLLQKKSDSFFSHFCFIEAF